MADYANYICTHQSGAHGVVYAADGPDAIEKYRKVFAQPVGNVTARLEAPAEGAARERDASARGSYRVFERGY